MATPTRLILILSLKAGTISYVMRASVPSGQEAAYEIPGAISPTGNASDPDLVGLIAGTIAQETWTVDLPQAAGETLAAYKTRVMARLLAQQAAFQVRVAAAAPQTFFGAYYDGAAWHASGG